MARKVRTYQGRRREIAHTTANAPQKKLRTTTETAMCSAPHGPTTRINPLRIQSNKTLVDCGTIARPGAFPSPIRIESQALYKWLERSPAWMCLCQKQGSRTRAEIVVMRTGIDAHQLAIQTRVKDGSGSAETSSAAGLATVVLIGEWIGRARSDRKQFERF